MSTLTNPPDVVTALSNKLNACASWDDWSIYYPTSASTDTPPLAVIEPGNTEYAQIAAGASSIRSGSARYIILLPTSYTVGQAEKLARDLCDELTSNPLGLWITSASSEMSSEPDEGDQPDEHITVTIDVAHGLGG